MAYLPLALITCLFVLQGTRYIAAVPDDKEVWSKGGPAVQSPDAVGLEGRYAVALYGAAKKAKNLEAVAKDLKAVCRKRRCPHDTQCLLSNFFCFVVTGGADARYRD